MPASEPIFTPDEIIEACKQAKTTPGGLASIMSIAEVPRSGANCKYLDITIEAGGKKGRPYIRLTNELHSGSIAPLEEADVAAVNAKNPKFPCMRRDKDPSLSVSKYDCHVPTDETGNLTGTLPDDSHLSKYFQAIEYIQEYYMGEMNARKDAGKIGIKNSGRPTLPGCLFVTNDRVVPMIQSHVSDDSKVNPGMALANPITRLPLKSDRDTKLMKAAFYDASTRTRNPKTGKSECDILTFDGEPVTAVNVHKIRRHSRFTTVAGATAVCISKMGISLPISLPMVAIKAPELIAKSLDDMFGDDDGDEIIPPTPEREAASNTTAPAPAPTPAPAEAVDEDAEAADEAAMDELVSQFGGVA